MTAPYRTALITGASSGLGRGLSLWFARRGVRVFATARRVDRLEALRAEAAAEGGVVEPVEMDVVHTQRTVQQIHELDQRCGGLDLVIANAGIGEETNARRLRWESVERILQVNVMGAAATLSAAVAPMVARGRGHLVGISSIAAYRGFPRMAAYCASKAFLKVFLESFRVDLKKTGVKVSSIHPGWVKTELTARNRDPMPFILELDDACERIGKAILRGQSEYIFPLPLAAGARAAGLLPNRLFDLAMAGAKRKSLKAST